MKQQPRQTLDPDPDLPELPEGLQFSEPDPEFEDSTYVIGSKAQSIEAPPPPLPRAPSAPKGWVKPMAVLLVLACVALTAWNVNRVMQGPEPLPPPSPFKVKQALYLGVLKVEAYRRNKGFLPDKASELDLPDTNYEFHRIDRDHYTLSFQAGDQKADYDSHNSKESVFGSPKSILATGASQ